MTRWSFAAPDWRDRLYARSSLVPTLPLDAAEADRAVNIFNALRLPDVEGRPTLGEAGGEWFRDIVRAVFGSLVDGVRRVPGVFLLVPKKNSKTTNGAAVMLTALLVNKRPMAQFALFGPTQEISDLAFVAAKGMIDADADLAKILRVQEHTKTITNRLTQATLKVQTFDPSVATGGKFAGWLLDEAHLLARVPYAARVVGQLRGARTAVPESFGIIITTQSDIPPSGFFRIELEHARKVRDGEVEDDTLLPVLYEFPREMQADKAGPWRDPATWPLVLPNLGRSVNLEVLTSDYNSARLKGDEEERRWLSQHLNLEIGIAITAESWPGAKYWPGAAAPMSLEEMLAACEVVTIGVDGGGLDDLLGLCVLGREKISKRWIAWMRAWADHGVKDLRKEIAAELDRLAARGDLFFIEVGDGDAEDIESVADIVERCHRLGLLPDKAGVGLDTAGIAAIGDAIEKRGVPAECIAVVSQGYRLSGTIKGAARKLKDGSLVHCAQDIGAWVVGNARVVKQGNADMITKQVSGTAKIDPLVALFNAFDLMARSPEPSGRHHIDDYFGHLAATQRAAANRTPA